MTDLEKILSEIEERCNKYASYRSDDFGHDTQALLLAESEALTLVAEYDVPKLIRALRKAVEQRNTYMIDGAVRASGTALAQTLVDKYDKELAEILGGE